MSAKSTAPSCSTRRRADLAAIGALVILGSSVVATAQPADRLDLGVSAPKAWEEDADLVVPLQQHFRETLSLDEHGETGGAAAYISAGTGALYVAWIKTTKPTEKAADALRATLDQLRAEPKSAALESDAIEELEYNEQIFKNAIEARMAWRHKDNETLTISRALAWQNTDKLLRVVRAECVFPESEKETVTPLCKGALLSLSSTELDGGKAIELVGFVKPKAPEPEAKKAPVESTGPTLNPTAKTTPMVVTNDAKKKPRDRKNLWIFIIGAVLIAFAFYSILQSKREADEGARAADADEDDSARQEEE